MVWAIDLDNGTTIDELGENLNREKEVVYTEDELNGDVGDLGTPMLNTTTAS